MALDRTRAPIAGRRPDLLVPNRKSEALADLPCGPLALFARSRISASQSVATTDNDPQARLNAAWGPDRGRAGPSL